MNMDFRSRWKDVKEKRREMKTKKGPGTPLHLCAGQLLPGNNQDIKIIPNAGVWP